MWDYSFYGNNRVFHVLNQENIHIYQIDPRNGVIAFVSQMDAHAFIFTMDERRGVIDDLRVYLDCSALFLLSTQFQTTQFSNIREMTGCL